MTPTQTSQWTPEMLETFGLVRRSVHQMVKEFNRPPEDADDLAQTLFVVATENMHRYDPSRANFNTWLMAIAKNLVYRRTHRAKENPVGTLRADDENTVNALFPTTEDVGHEVTEEIFTAHRVSRVMELVYEVVDSRFMVDRSLVLVRECNGNVAKAATRLGITAETLRHSHRTVQDLVHIIDRSLNLYDLRQEQGKNGQPLSVRELLSCFPEDADHEWMRSVPIAVLRCGGWTVPRAQLITEVSQLTGYSAASCRLLLSKCEQYYMVARTLGEHGRLRIP